MNFVNKTHISRRILQEKGEVISEENIKEVSKHYSYGNSTYL